MITEETKAAAEQVLGIFRIWNDFADQLARITAMRLMNNPDLRNGIPFAESTADLEALVPHLTEAILLLTTDVPTGHKLVHGKHPLYHHAAGVLHDIGKTGRVSAAELRTEAKLAAKGELADKREAFSWFGIAEDNPLSSRLVRSMAIAIWHDVVKSDASVKKRAPAAMQYTIENALDLGVSKPPNDRGIVMARGKALALVDTTAVFSPRSWTTGAQYTGAMVFYLADRSRDKRERGAPHPEIISVKSGRQLASDLLGVPVEEASKDQGQLALEASKRINILDFEKGYTWRVGDEHGQITGRGGRLYMLDIVQRHKLVFALGWALRADAFDTLQEIGIKPAKYNYTKDADYQMRTLIPTPGRYMLGTYIDGSREETWGIQENAYLRAHALTAIKGGPLGGIDLGDDTVRDQICHASHLDPDVYPEFLDLVQREGIYVYEEGVYKPTSPTTARWLDVRRERANQKKAREKRGKRS